MDFIEVTAKTYDEAVTNALVELGTTSDQVEIEIIEKGSAGFLGFGSKPAKIRVRKKIEEKEIVTEEKIKQENSDTCAPKTERKQVISDKSVDDYIKEFLSAVFDAMNLEVEIIVNTDEETHVVDVELKGPEMGVLIGKRGQTLDALQLIANNAVHKNFEVYYKVKVDTENYRVRRKETLENLARNIAYKVKRTKRPVSLEPMNPFERRVIHSALQNDKYVTTHSEGEDPYRHVVVTLKK